MFLLLMVHLLLGETGSVPAEPFGKNVPVKEVPYGETVLLTCRSNDRHYIFDFWLFNPLNLVIGPSNAYDKSKYRYEILSGNLTIRGVTKYDEGLYSCISKDVYGGKNTNVENVRVVVLADWQEVYEHDSSINTIRTLIVLIVLVILAIGGYYLYVIWRDRYRYPSYLAQDDDDDDDSAEEIFTAPSTSGLSKPGPSKPAGPIVLDQNNPFDSISTDFKSILDTANDK